MGQQFIITHLGQARLIFAGLIHVSVVTGGSSGRLPRMSSSWLAVSWGVAVPGDVFHSPVGYWVCSRGHSRVHEGEGPGGLGQIISALLLPQSVGQSKS